jgi:hypothetical protein
MPSKLTFNIINGNKNIATVSAVDSSVDLLKFFEDYYLTSLKLHTLAPASQTNNIQFLNPNHQFSLELLDNGATRKSNMSIPPGLDMDKAKVKICLMLSDLLPHRKIEWINAFRAIYKNENNNTPLDIEFDKVYSKQYNQAILRYFNFTNDVEYLYNKMISLINDATVVEMILNLHLNIPADDFYSAPIIRKAAYFNALTFLINKTNGKKQ